MAAGLGWLVAIAATTAVIVTGHDPGAAPTTVTTVPFTVVVPTTIAAPATVLALATTPAQPDWTVLVQTILAYDVWLKTHPDPARLSDYMDPQHPDYPDGLYRLGQLASGEIRWTVAPPPLTASSVTLRVRDDTRATVLVQLDARRGGEYVDQAGHVTRLTDSPAGPVVWRLVRSPEGRWRLAGVQAP